MMKRLLFLSAIVGVAACATDRTVGTPAVQDPQVTAPEAPSADVLAMVRDGFATNAAGFSETNNSFVAGLDAFAPWMPPGLAKNGMGSNPDFMGGGLADDFAGGMMFGGPGMGHGREPFAPFDDRNCTYWATVARVVCPTLKVGGLTIDRSFAYTDAAGKAQTARDDATNTVNSRSTVAGLIVSRHNDSTTVSHSSDQTVSGLVKTSTKRVVDGTSKGNESTKGVNEKGDKFLSVRVMGDTTKGLTTPVTTGKPSYPTAGSVTRSMKVTVTIGTQAPTTSTRREVVTYDGSATAKVDITVDGTTKHCTMPLPRGRLACQ